MSDNCTKCKSDDEGDLFWEFGDEKLCQTCWESHCSETWWEMVKQYEDSRMPNYCMRIKNGWEIIGSNYRVWKACLWHRNIATESTMLEVFWDLLDDRGLNL